MSNAVYCSHEIVLKRDKCSTLSLEEKKARSARHDILQEVHRTNACMRALKTCFFCVYACVLQRAVRSKRLTLVDFSITANVVIQVKDSHLACTGIWLGVDHQCTIKKRRFFFGSVFPSACVWGGWECGHLQTMENATNSKVLQRVITKLCTTIIARRSKGFL